MKSTQQRGRRGDLIHPRGGYLATRAILPQHTEDTTNVRQLFCTLEESEGDTDAGDAYAAQLAQIADRMRDRLAPKWTDLSSRAEKLMERSRTLMKVEDEEDRKGANVILGKLVKTMNSIQNVLNNELKGANDPEVRAQIELGKLEHKRIQDDRGKCEAGKITIPGEGMRLDCVKACTIYEIKPNNSRAISKGKTRAQEYRDGVQRYFDKSDKTKLNERFSDKLQVFLKCIDGNKITLSYDVIAYDFCPADGKLFNDFIVPAD